MYENKLTGFFKTIQHHEWITPTHISIYLAILELWNQNSFKNPVSVSRNKIMAMAKISGNATYHKCLRELVKGKYISYLPSYNPFIGSLIIMHILKDINKP
jgi:replicative DNA helicase